jgi:hypothetical protein
MDHDRYVFVCLHCYRRSYRSMQIPYASEYNSRHGSNVVTQDGGSSEWFALAQLRK